MVRLLNKQVEGDPVIICTTVPPKVVVPPVWFNWPVMAKFPRIRRSLDVVREVPVPMFRFSSTVLAMVVDLIPPPVMIRFLKVVGAAGKI
jgi:hypothetical protein